MEDEQETVHDSLRQPIEISEEDLNELVEYFKEEAYPIDIDADELEIRCEEFLRTLASTYYTSIETSIGRLHLAYSGHLLQFVSLEEEAVFLEKAERLLGVRPIPDEKSHLPVEMIELVRTTVESHVVYNGPIDLSCLTDFQKMVLAHIRSIVPGEIRSYEALAQALGQPDAVKIAEIINNNPFPVVVPCHRAVANDGYLGEYCSGGMAVKKRLLEREGVKMQGDYVIFPEKAECGKVKAATAQQTHFPQQEQEEALYNYLGWLDNRYRYIHTQESFPGVDIVEFAEVYYPQQLHVSTTATEWKKAEELGMLSWPLMQDNPPQESYQQLEAVVQSHPYVVIRGEPGSGKTTTLRYLALTYVKRMLAKLHYGYTTGQQLLPIPLQLVDYVNSGLLVGEPLRDFLVEYFEQHDCPTTGLAELLSTAFDEGRCLVLLDGLDEVGTIEQQLGLVRQINRFVNCWSHPGNHFVVTSRIAGYYQYLTKPFVHCTIQGMDYKEVDQFLHQWIAVVKMGERSPSGWIMHASQRKEEQKRLERTLKRLVRLTHSRITYRSHASQKSPASITPLLVQVVIVISHTLMQQHYSCFSLTQQRVNVEDEDAADHNEQHPYSWHDHLIIVFSEKIYTHYLSHRVQNSSKETGKGQKSGERSYLNSINEYPSTAVEDILRYFSECLDERTKKQVEELFREASEKADNIIAQSRGIMVPALC